MAFIKDNPPPATVILISGDRDFAYLLSTIRWRKYNVVLISNSSMTHESLTVQASVAYDWKSDILKARPPTKPPVLGSRILSPVASLAAPQEFDKSHEVNPHPVGFSIVRVNPDVQPLTLSSRPAGTTMSMTRPRRATLPQDALSMESEVTPIPPTVGIPAEAGPAGIPVNHTSDDWIEADSVGRSAMVHLLIARGVAVDPIS